MSTKKLSFDSIAFLGMTLLALLSVGYILMTLVYASQRNSTAFSQESNIVKHAKFVVLDTSAGQIRIELLRKNAPVAVNNFVSLAHEGFYDKTKFHRVMEGMLIQGGDPLTREPDRELYGTGGPGYVFDHELSDLPMVRGVVAMANLGRPKTNGSQFFILTANDAPFLNGNYTIFGRVLEGMSVVDKISVGEVGEREIPTKPVVIENVYIE